MDNCVSDNDHILSPTLLLINILYIIYVLDSFAWISLINVCMYNGSLPVGLGLISHVLLKTNFHYLKVRKKSYSWSIIQHNLHFFFAIWKILSTGLFQVLGYMMQVFPSCSMLKPSLHLSNNIRCSSYKEWTLFDSKLKITLLISDQC